MTTMHSSSGWRLRCADRDAATLNVDRNLKRKARASPGFSF